MYATFIYILLSFL